MQIFVAMPLGPKEKPEVREVIRTAVDRAGFVCRFPDEIAGHGVIVSDVMDEISRSVAVIVEMSDRNPSVIWEWGWASAIGKPAFPISDNEAALFFDTQHYRAIIYERDKLEESLGQKPITWCNMLRKDNVKLNPVHLVHSKQMAGSSSLILGLNGVGETEFDFYGLLGVARKHFFTCAQNHHFLVNDIENLKSRLRAFFEGGENRRFDLLMCDPGNRHGVEAWTSLSLPAYVNHLDKAASVFDELVRWARDIPAIGGRLNVRKVPFVPISVNFVDPEQDDGLLVATLSFLKSENMGRHATVISKKTNRYIFMQYWSWASNLFTLFE